MTILCLVALAIPLLALALITLALMLGRWVRE
jgi:hypothetical protein